jgi:hypothetical protein
VHHVPVNGIALQQTRQRLRCVPPGVRYEQQKLRLRWRHPGAASVAAQRRAPGACTRSLRCERRSRIATNVQTAQPREAAHLGRPRSLTVGADLLLQHWPASAADLASAALIVAPSVLPPLHKALTRRLVRKMAYPPTARVRARLTTELRVANSTWSRPMAARRSLLFIASAAAAGFVPALSLRDGGRESARFYPR